MRAIVDVHYSPRQATAACVVFKDWEDQAPAAVLTITLPAPAAYRPGRFYERELACLMAVLQAAGYEFETIVIDGYVHLQAPIGKGLGAHLHGSLTYAPVVVGVAKTPLTVADRFVPVFRGRSRRPLFVSAIGCPVEQAARSIAGMHGPYRLPTLLKQTDQYARTDRKGVCNVRQGFFGSIG